MQEASFPPISQTLGDAYKPWVMPICHRDQQNKLSDTVNLGDIESAKLRLVFENRLRYLPVVMK